MLNELVFGVIGAAVVYHFVRCLLETLSIRDLSTKPVLVTGCDSGFGNELAVRCAREGVPVFASCLTQQGIDQLVEQVGAKAAGTLLHCFLLEVCSAESVKNAVTFVERVIEERGYKGLHALVNNAGVVGNASWDDWLTPDDYQSVWEINTLGVIRVTHAFKHLIKRMRGRIITVASICGRVALPGIGPYTVSKYGVEAYCDTIRLELSQFNVKVIILEPGFFKTPITDEARNVKMLEMLWERAPQSMRDEYGQDYFEFTKKKTLEGLKMKSPNTELVVDAYYHAITARLPRKRYQIGYDSVFFFIPFSMLPTVAQDWFFWVLALVTKPPKPRQLYA